MRQQRTRSRGPHVLVYTDTYARTYVRTYVCIPNRVLRKHPVLVSSVASHPSRMGTSIRACELKQCAACAAATCRDLGATAIALGFFKTMRRLRRGRMPRPTYVPTLQPQPAEQLVQCFCFRSAWSRPASLSIPLFGGHDAWHTNFEPSPRNGYLSYRR